MTTDCNLPENQLLWNCDPRLKTPRCDSHIIPETCFIEACYLNPRPINFPEDYFCPLENFCSHGSNGTTLWQCHAQLRDIPGCNQSNPDQNCRYHGCLLPIYLAGLECTWCDNFSDYSLWNCSPDIKTIPGCDLETPTLSCRNRVCARPIYPDETKCTWCDKDENTYKWQCHKNLRLYETCTRYMGNYEDEIGCRYIACSMEESQRSGYLICNYCDNPINSGKWQCQPYANLIEGCNRQYPLSFCGLMICNSLLPNERPIDLNCNNYHYCTNNPQAWNCDPRLQYASCDVSLNILPPHCTKLACDLIPRPLNLPSSLCDSLVALSDHVENPSQLDGPSSMPEFPVNIWIIILIIIIIIVIIVILVIILKNITKKED